MLISSLPLKLMEEQVKLSVVSKGARLSALML
jgi:hypothetical protein